MVSGSIRAWHPGRGYNVYIALGAKPVDHAVCSFRDVRMMSEGIPLLKIGQMDLKDRNRYVRICPSIDKNTRIFLLGVLIPVNRTAFRDA